MQPREAAVHCVVELLHGERHAIGAGDMIFLGVREGTNCFQVVHQAAAAHTSAARTATAAAEKEGGGKLRLRGFIVEAKDADAIGDEPIRYEGEVKGWVTSGGYAHASRVSVAMGYVAKEIADKQYGWSIDILGETLPAAPQIDPLFDPSAERMRG